MTVRASPHGRRAAVVAAAAVFASAEVAGALELEDALARARVASPVVRTARAAVDGARGRLAQAAVWAPNPVVSTQLARHTGPDGPDYVDREVALGQEVEVGGQRGLRIAAARHDVAHADALLAEALRTVEADVRRSFTGAVAAERRLDLVRDADVVASRILDATRRRATAGDVATLDVRLAEIEAVRAAQAVGTADLDRRRAEDRLAAAIGAPADEELTARGADEEARPVPAEDVLVAHALASRPDVVAARAERARLDGEATLIRREALVPNPVLRGFYRQEFGNERIAGGEVALPLPVWNRQQGAETAARASASAAAADVDRLERDIPREVRTALARRTAAVRAWTRYRRDAVPAEREARSLVERAFGGGAIGLPEVLTEESRLRDTRAAAVDAWAEMSAADADLIEAVGGKLP